MTFTIRPLKIGSLAGFEKSKFTYFRDFGEKVEAPCLAFLLEGNGKKILVDGGPPCKEFAEKYHAAMLVTEEDNLSSRLKAAGVDPSKIDYVIITHLHWDHCYNLEHVPDVPVYIQTTELSYAACPMKMHRLAYDVGIKGVTPAWFKYFDRIITVDGDTELEPGLSVVLIPGHTPGSQGVVVDTKDGKYMIAGDFLPLYENWYNPDGFIPTGIHTDLAQLYATAKKIASITNKVIPGHDIRVLEHEIIG